MSESMGQARGSSNFIDAHVHLWTDDFQKYPLAACFRPEDMEPRSFLPADILGHARPNGVNRIVLVQMSYYGFDNRYMLEVIGRQPEVFRGIAVIDQNADNPEIRMRDLARRGVRGFRVFPQNGSSQAWLEGEGLDKMFRYAAEESLAMCLLVNPDALGSVQRKCESFPNTPVVIDHIARIGMSGPIKRSDIRALCSLARLPNVRVKVSAFYALGEKKPPHSDLIPLIKQVYEAFGEQRLMWGSDCPFQLQSETYMDSIFLVLDNLSFLTGEAKEWILSRTAEATFFR